MLNLTFQTHSQQQQNKTLTDEETLRLIREIAAYFGLVLVHQAEGQWETRSTLWHTYILIEGPIKVVKASQSRMSSSPLAISLGNHSASAWDAVTQGLPSRLYAEFRAAKRKLAKGL